MTTGPMYFSDAEITKRLQTVLRSFSEAGSDRTRKDSAVREVRTLAAEIGERIYDEPESWGISGIAPEFRDDAAAAALVLFLLQVPSFRASQSAQEWFANAAEKKHQQFRDVSQRKGAEREVQEETERRLRDEQPEETSDAVAAFEDNRVWKRFEGKFPRDASALRLRYLLKRDVEEMAAMLDAPSPRAVTMRINRARDRFRTFCENAGLNVSETTEMLEMFVEEQAS